MKTPKRKFKFPMDSLNGLGTRLAFEAEEVPTAHSLQCERWHRRNRIAQLKHTIAKQAEEIDHLRTALAIRTILDINESNIESLKFIQRHLTVETFQPQIEQEGDHNLIFKWKRPIPRWNNSIIDLHLPEDHP